MPSEVPEITVRMQLSRSVTSFHDLLMVAEGLNEIDNLSALWLDMGWPRLGPKEEYLWFRRRFGPSKFTGTSKIQRFEISSPPILIFGCPIELLGIFLAMFGAVGLIWNMVATYDDFKRGVESIRNDVRKSISELTGLSDRAKRWLLEFMDHLIDRLLSLAEADLQAALNFVRRTQDARLRLAQPNEPVHSRLEVIEDHTDMSEL